MYYEKFMNNIYTSSGWASDSTFASVQAYLRGKWNTQHTEGGVILFNHGGDLIVDGGDECRHVLIIGTTGTGKSRLIIMPSLVYSLHAKEQRSFVVFDVKGKLKAATMNAARENNYSILNINFCAPVEGDKWNPFFRANTLYATGESEKREKAWKLLEDIIASIFSDGGASSKIDPFGGHHQVTFSRHLCCPLGPW